MRDFLPVFIDIFFSLLIFAIFVRVVFSWLRFSMDGGIFSIIREATEPVLRLARRVTPRLGMIDLSPLIALIVLNIIHKLLLSLFI
ncbi:MAG: YggT family protein [Patescibacteria group bacterium]